MKPILFILLLFLSACSYHVVRVIDGDTIEVLNYFNEPIRIRLAGIDAPELSQPFGQEARLKTSELCAGKQVKISSSGKDKYGRTIAFVTVGQISVNKELLRSGLAWHYYYFDHSPELTRIETEARIKHLGLWADKNPIEPWKYRKLYNSKNY
jgi:micrococcal nuclease